MGLNVAWGSLETCGALVQMAVNVNVSKFPALETGFMVTGVVMNKGHIVVAAGLLDFYVSDGYCFLFGQRR